MFRFAKKREVLWPVTINVPSDGGGVEEQSFNVRYVLLTKTQMQGMIKGINESTDVDVLIAAQDDTLKAHIVDWEGLVTEKGEPLKYSEDVLTALLDIPYIRAALDAGLWAASRGAPAKNSQPGPVGLQA